MKTVSQPTKEDLKNIEKSEILNRKKHFHSILLKDAKCKAFNIKVVYKNDN